METISVIDPGTATGPVKDVFDQVTKIMGRVPRMMQLLGQSPAAAQAYLQFNLSLSKAELPITVRSLIAAAVAETNGCEYSRRIASGQAKSAGVAEEAVRDACHARSADPKLAAALRFAVSVVERRGRVAEQEVRALEEEGYSEPEIVEIIATVILGLFRDYFNLAAGTSLD